MLSSAIAAAVNSLVLTLDTSHFREASIGFTLNLIFMPIAGIHFIPIIAISADIINLFIVHFDRTDIELKTTILIVDSTLINQ